MRVVEGTHVAGFAAVDEGDSDQRLGYGDQGGPMGRGRWGRLRSPLRPHRPRRRFGFDLQIDAIDSHVPSGNVTRKECLCNTLEITAGP